MPRYWGVLAALIATAAFLIAPLARARTTRSPHQFSAAKRAPGTAVRSLPILFEPSPEAGAGFVARSRGYTIRVTPTGAFLRLPADVASKTVELAFPGAAPTRVLPDTTAKARINYLIGARDAWRIGVPAYERVRLSNLYPGVDAVFYGSGGNLEYDLIISPGASLDRIRVAYAGADAVGTSGDGLTVRIGAASIIERRLDAYQDIDGHRIAVRAHYVVSHDEVRFAVGPYDRRHPLVLDPVITYSTYFGGSGSDSVTSMRTDAAGRLYVAGWAQQGDFPVAPQEAHSSTGTAPQADAYVAKFEGDGSVDWLTFIGGGNDDEANGIDIGGNGDIYVGGATRSADFPTTAGSFHPAAPATGDQDIFVLRLSPDGTTLRYSTCLGATQSWAGAGAAGIRVDSQGGAYIVGQTGSPAFPVTIAESRGASDPGLDNRDAFIARISGDGSTLEWARLLAGSKWETAAALQLDRTDSVYVVGSTTSDDFPVLNALFPQKSGPGDQTGSTGHDGFLACIDRSGNLIFSTYLGGTGEDDMYAVAQGQFDRIYVGGATTSDGLDSFTAKQSPSGEHSGILFEIAPNGSSEIAARYVYTPGYSTIRALAIGRDWSVWSAGESDGNDWHWVNPDSDDGFFQSTYGGGRTDIGIQQRDAQLSTLAYSALFGGGGDERATTIASDTLVGDIYFAGETSSPNYPVLDAIQPTPHDADIDGVIDRLACSIREIQPVPVQPATGGTDATRSVSDPWCLIAGTSDAPWLHVTGTSGAQVAFATDPNPTTSERVARITITGRAVVPIIQAAGDGSSTGGSVDEIVLNAADAQQVAGRWRKTPDSLHGTILSEADEGDPKLTAPLAAPANYVEFTFAADANRPYHLWIHGLAENDSYLNDSAWVQFSDSIDASGSAIWRIGTTDGTFVSLEPCSGCGEQGWGWRDNHYGGGLAAYVLFATAGLHTMRIQQREDGFAIGQATLSAVKYLTTSPGADRNDATVLQKPSGNTPVDEIVLWPGSGTNLVSSGDWARVADATAAGGGRIWEPDQGGIKIAAPAPNPSNYFDVVFNAEAGKAYHLWLRMKAQGDSWQNDSVWVQFSGSLDAARQPAYRIGTTSGTWVSLEECSGCGEQGWGWQDNAYGSPGDLGPDIFFAQSGPQTIRVQQREDGVSIDQIVLSAVKFAGTPPGPARNDATILSRTQ